MQPADIIKESLAYIEQNLKTDIAAGELAEMAGYSLWHYHRLFAQAMGVSVAAYIARRRLDHALGEIAAGRRAADVVLEYGFDTYAGFYKAFVRMYGCSPKKYLSLYGTHQTRMEVSVMRQYSQRELRTVLRQWDIPQTLPIQDIYIMDGSKVSGSIWSVGENYILKTADRVELLRNLCVAKALVAQGFAAQIPILTRDGREFAEGQAIFALCRRMKGNPLPKADRFGEKRAVYGLKLGQSIARLHSALAAAEADLQPSEKNLFAQVTEWALPEVQKQNVRWRMGLPDRFFADYISGFGALFDKLPKQLIHRDPNPGNILFENGEVAGFIDFDLSERSVRLWDPCYCATGILSEWRGVDEIQAKWPDILRGILQGYDSVNPLTAEEKQALFHVICSIQMICIAYFESEDDYKELAKTSREMLRYIVEKETEIRQFFA